MFRTLLFAFLLIAGFPVPSNSISTCLDSHRAFRSGEELNYKVYYTWGGAYVGAGEARFTATLNQLENKPVWHVQGEGHTYPSYDWFFKVRDLYESYIDTATGLPLKFIRRIHEGGNRLFYQANFNPNLNRAVSQDGVFTIPTCTQDVLSAIYAARNIDFNRYRVGDKIPINLFLDNQVYPVYIRFLGREKITTKFGTFQTIKFKPLLIEGTIFKGGEKMEVWVTDDLNRIPVMVNTPILVGNIRVFLKNYKQLKYPATGIVQFNVSH
ncbi:MAG: DUF3108 domain-containing protein [Chitinophagaceae bacterium]